MSTGGMGLGVNVDVSNQTFWIGQKFEQLARNFLSCMDRKWENSECPDYPSPGQFVH
jgi:eukaryotic translation initiation factor 2C